MWLNRISTSHLVAAFMLVQGALPLRKVLRCVQNCRLYYHIPTALDPHTPEGLTCVHPFVDIYIYILRSRSRVESRLFCIVFTYRPV
jgi:hypothetical protein